jgi:phospholipase/lecithinase/hemolysin
MRRILTSLGFVLALAVVAGSASAEPFSQIWVFGGPLEDTGNFASVFGDLPAPFFHNRFSNGPLAVEILAAQLGLTLKPSLHRIGPAQGNNFSSADGLASGPDSKDLHGQIDAYFAMTGNKADPKALYYMIIGGNEVIAATFEPNDAKSVQIVKGAVDAKERAIHRLVAAGAKTMLVPNFIDISITPQIRAAGLARRGNKVSALHNRLMARMLDRVERQLDFHLIRDDFHVFANDVLDSADILRFTNTTDSCLAALATGTCDFDHFIFFNDLFPTHRVHDLWGWTLVSDVIRGRAHPAHHDANDALEGE